MERFLIVMRFFQFASVMVLFGAALFPFYALNEKGGKQIYEDQLTRFLEKIFLYGSLLALISALGWLSAEAVLMSGDAEGYREVSILLKILNNTQFGRIWEWRLALLALLPIVFLFRAQTSLRLLCRTVLLGSMFLLVSLSGVGHGAMGTGFDVWVHLGNQMIHLLGASIWVGGLLSLFYIILSTKKSGACMEVLQNALRQFSKAGLIAVLFIIFSGGLNSWFLVGSFGALLHTSYGQVLLIKLSFFLGMIALALLNRLVLLPNLLRKKKPDQHLHLLLWSVGLEQASALLIIAVVSVLGTLPPAFDMSGMVM